MFNLNIVEAGDVWLNEDGDHINVVKVHLGQYAAWYLGRFGSSLNTVTCECESLIENGSLVSRGGVKHLVLEDGAVYPAMIIGETSTVIRLYDCYNDVMKDFDGNSWSTEVYSWIGKKIKVDNAPHE
tara:strand:+ start:422 stop:802 length:381 start_codon:yes stop_codon:yes gene_type:complete